MKKHTEIVKYRKAHGTVHSKDRSVIKKEKAFRKKLAPFEKSENPGPGCAVCRTGRICLTGPADAESTMLPDRFFREKPWFFL